MKYENVIAAEGGSKFNIKELLKCKDLIILFVKRDFVVKYKQTILGPLWAVIQPLMTTIVFNLIFGKLAKLTISDSLSNTGQFMIPGFLFYMIGTIYWSYFSQTVTGISYSFVNNQKMLGKVYFPRIVIPISEALSGLIPFGIRFVMFIGVYVYFFVGGEYDIKINRLIFLLPVLLIQLVLMGIAFGLIIASVTIKYRDMLHLMNFGMQLWHYVTPVAYGLALIPQKYFGVYMLNPVTMVILISRYAFFGTGYFSIGYYLLSWGVTLIMLILGLLLFKKVERTFMDTI